MPPVPDGIEEPPVLPDLAVRRAPGGSWLGAGRPASRVPVTIDAGARAGQRVTFVFRVGHDGPDPATIVLTGRGRDLHAGVVWRLDGRDVTEAVDRGDLRVLVDPGAHRDLTLGVTLRQFAPAGFALTRTLTAEALGGARDRVRAVVTRGPSPVRFHDVGLALGLPRHTHSFDVDAAPVDGDGVDDLVISTHGRVEVFLNHQPGLETVLTRSGGDIHTCAVGDADGDGRADVYCTVGAENGTGSKRNRLWLQQPEGGFGPNRAAHYGVDDPYGRGRHPTFVDLDRRLGTDLFVGNENPRADDNVSLNRTFLHAETAEFSDVRLGMRSDIGGLCAQAADQDGNGWDDLLVCGGAGLATVGWNPGDNQLHLFRNLRRHDGGRRLVDVAPRLGIDLDGVQAARLAHLDGDGHLDLVVVRRDSVSVWPGAAGGTFRLRGVPRGSAGGPRDHAGRCRRAPRTRPVRGPGLRRPAGREPRGPPLPRRRTGLGLGGGPVTHPRRGLWRHGRRPRRGRRRDRRPRGRQRPMVGRGSRPGADLRPLLGLNPLAPPGRPRGRTGPMSDTDLRRIADDYWEAVMVASPVYATFVGDHRFDDRMDDLSEAAEDANLTVITGIVARAEALDPGALSAGRAGHPEPPPGRGRQRPSPH